MAKAMTDEQIDTIAEGQTSVAYEGNGPFIVKQQIKHAVEQALKLESGEEIILPNGEKLKL